MDTVKSKGVVGSDQEQNVQARGIHTHSNFGQDRLGYDFYDTLRFGEYHPFTFMETVPNDKRIRAQFMHSIQSYTLKAPLMQAIKINKMLCQVPREAILPLNWEKWFKNPVIGQDVPDDCGTSIAEFWTKIQLMYTPLVNAWISDATDTTPPNPDTFIKETLLLLILGEYFYSNGSLLKSCGITGTQYFAMFDSAGNRHHSFDEWFDKIIAMMVQRLQSSTYSFKLTHGGETYDVYTATNDDAVYSNKTINFREMLCLLRDEPVFNITGTNSTSVEDFRTDLANDQEVLLITIYGDDETPIDIKRLWAYQMTCAHFCTNDKIDFIFSAELFRQYINQLEKQDFSQDAIVGKFTVNGLNYQYDYLSAYYFNKVITALTDWSTNGTWNPTSSPAPSSLNDALAYLAAIFAYRRSLRYLDYFTGSRTQPLAVGDVNVQVNSNLVSVIDTVQKNFLARMLNAINIAGMRNYVEQIFGVKQASDWHNPQYLLTLTDTVYGERVENTGADQWSRPNSVTSVLRGNSDRYAFEMDFDRSSIVIGIAWFDIERAYAYATERQNLHYDRFDEFQPYMQYIGDQKLYRAELGTPQFGSSSLTGMDAFGYKLRNEEYKQRYTMCAGGFVENLPGYIFKADIMEASGIQNQGSSFIRSFQSELDKFYLTLNGWSLGSYFHFICKWKNLYSGNRPMAVAPTIL